MGANSTERRAPVGLTLAPPWTSKVCSAVCSPSLVDQTPPLTTVLPCGKIRLFCDEELLLCHMVVYFTLRTMTLL